jgi:uncharacterized membrane protein
MPAPIEYISVACLIVLLDIPWLTLSNEFVGRMIHRIQGHSLELKVLPALVVYLALAYLAFIPKTAVEAFALGLCVYAVYDFTNLATLTNYDWRFAVADSLWGGILFTLVFQLRNMRF